MKHLLHIALFGLAIITFGVSCQPNDQCYKENIVEMSVTFKDKNKAAVTLDSVTIQGVGSDSVLYANQKSVRTVSLPLQKTQNSTQYVFCSGNLVDTLTIEHTNTENFISLECGCFVYHTLQNIYSTGSWIDSVAIINPEITTANAQEHIQLFFN